MSGHRHQFVYERDSLRVTGAAVERCGCGKLRVRRKPAVPELVPEAPQTPVDRQTDLASYLKAGGPLPSGWQEVEHGSLGYAPSPASATHFVNRIVRDGWGALGTLWLCRRVFIGRIHTWPKEHTWDTIHGARCKRCNSLVRLFREMGVGSQTSYVYYAQRGDYIKIGWSRSVGIRMEVLGADLLAVEPGEAWLERLRHRRFASQAVGGEWFEAREPLTAYIADLRHGFDEQAPLAPWKREWGLQKEAVA